MFKISGKQYFGAVWQNGKCIAHFNRGVALTNDPEAAKALADMGYVVEGEADGAEPAVEPKTTEDAETEGGEQPRRSPRKKSE
jgi:hypothetical protein